MKPEQKTPDSRPSSFFRKHPGATISIIAIISTLSLYAYFLGVLDRFHLEPSLFPLSIEQAYQLGIAFLVRAGWTLTLIIIIGCTLLSYLVFILLLLIINTIAHWLSKKIPIISSSQFSPIDTMEPKAVSVALVIATFVWFGLFYLLGQEKPVNRNIIDYSTTIKMKGKNGALYKDVALILCSQFCAIHVKDNTQSEEEPTILLLPASDIEYIKQKLTKANE